MNLRVSRSFAPLLPLIIVAAADKLHYARAMLSDARKMGEQSWSRFKAPKEDQLWLYDAIVETLRSTTTAPALVDELERVVCAIREYSTDDIFPTPGGTEG